MKIPIWWLWCGAILLGCGQPTAPVADAGPDAGGSMAPVSLVLTGSWAADAGHCGDAGWCFESSSVGSPLLKRAWVAGPNDAWAAGPGGLLHWDGARWSRASTPFSQADLGAVHGSGANDVWVAAKAAAHHWNGSAWTTHPIAIGAYDPPRGIWMASAQDGWMLGGYPTLRRWNGTQWTNDASLNDKTIYAISGSASNDVWAVGEKGAVFHFDGTAWSLVGSGTTDLLHDVWVAAKNDVWVVGPGGVRRFNGTAWSAVDTKPATGLFAISGRSPADVWITGFAGELGHFDGTAWSKVDASSTAVLYGLAPTATGMWAVGEGGTVLKVSPTAVVPMTTSLVVELEDAWASAPDDLWIVGSRGSLIRFDGVTWRSYRLGDSLIGQFFTAVSGTGPSDVWICGASSVLHWDGAGWKTAHPKLGLEATDIWAAGPSDVWLAADGEISHWDGATWTLAQLPAAAGSGGYKSVHGSGPSDVWAVGAAGSIAHYDGQLWKKVPSGVSAYLTRVFSHGPGLAWAVGQDAIVWNGTNWARTAPLPEWITTSLSSVRAGGAADVWVSGLRGLSHWDGVRWTTWRSGDLGTGGALNAVWTGPGATWAVGSGGAILRR